MKSVNVWDVPKPVPVVAKYVDSPSGQRIIVDGISGTAGGAVLGAVAGTPVVGIGALPSALGGAIIGGPVNMLKQLIKEVFGIPGIIDEVLDIVKDTMQEKRPLHASKK